VEPRDDKADETLKGDDQESFWDVVPFRSKFDEYKSFWRTREAVLGGEALHKLSKAELKERGLMGPMKFNIVQSTISSLPALAVLQVVHEKIIPTFDNLPEFDKVFATLAVFVVPFTLLLAVFSIRCTLRNRTGQSPDVMKRAGRCLGRHYLYLDAAYRRRI